MSTTLDTTNFIQCSRCVLDTTAKDISFDQDGVCNYCRAFEKVIAKRNAQDRKSMLNTIIASIKAEGKGKQYDCVLGLSGGVDSSYLAILAHEFGLRPLVIHLDNGWNSRTAVENIERIVKTLGFDLFTHVIDWEKFKDLQLAYFKSGVVDLEVPTDQLITAAVMNYARKHSIKYYLSGVNYQTEGIMPAGWNFMNKCDLTNTRNIHAKFGKSDISSFPTWSYYTRFIDRYFRGIQRAAFLELIDYDKEEAKATLKERFGWQDYGGKHFESIFTRFYQGYILPKRFNVDKRKAHFSTIINMGRMTRAQALLELQNEPYPKDLQESDKTFVCRKWEISESEFDSIMAQPIVPHEAYGTEDGDLLRKPFDFVMLSLLYKFFYPLNILKKR